MILFKITLLVSVVFLLSCTANNQNTIAGLNDVEIELEDVVIAGGVQKAMQSYQQFLEKTPDSAMTPEAIRRLADLNIEQEYGVISEADQAALTENPVQNSTASIKQTSDEFTSKPATGKADKNLAVISEKKDDKAKKPDLLMPLPDGTNLEDLQTAGAKKAISLYKKLLIQFPLYERNDQVLYQLSRAYEETGELDKAMKVSNRLVTEYPDSRHFSEVQFRRGEYFFTRKKLLDAEDAYKSLLDRGKGSGFYALALYKRGWTFYKQELYDDALHHFIGLLDYKLETGYDFDQQTNKSEKKRMDDTYRVISLSFSNIGGAESVIEYFKKNGARSFESNVYSQLAEFYFKKRRYSDAAKTYQAYIKLNPFNKKSPHFSMRVIDIYHKGGFPRLVIEAKKDYSSTYGLRADYWKYFNVDKHADVIQYLQKNITDLANHYHAMYQNPRHRKKSKDNFKEASHWYKEFLLSFPKDEQSPVINYQLADLYLENKNFLSAAREYEITAYNYPQNKKSSAAGYAAVATYRVYLKRAKSHEINTIKREVIRSSLRFVDVFPKHKKAALILAAAADDLYALNDFQLAVNASHQLINNYPDISIKLRRSSWLVIAYASFDLHKYNDAEVAFINVLAIKHKNKKQRRELMENLAAAVYKQGEQAVKLIDYKTASEHFLRVGRLVPASKIRSTAEYDAATAFIQLKDWAAAAEVMASFRKLFPKHKLLKDITKKMAFVYKEDKKFDKAAIEYERIFKESKDNGIRRESLLVAAELYNKISDKDNELRLYNRFLKYFPKPIEEALEINSKVAEIYLTKKQRKKHLKVLRHIVKIEARAGKARNDRTRYLAGMASLSLIEPLFTKFVAIKLKKPFKRNLNKKKKRMKANIKKYNSLVDYKVGDVTAAATYYIAETYYEFSKALMNSERPTKLNEIELEQYDIVLEEQAYPFEEKGINIHKKNLELLSIGIYSQWIDKSLKKLGELVPGRYAKHEETTGVLSSLLNYEYILPVKPVVNIIKEAAKGIDINKTPLPETK